MSILHLVKCEMCEKTAQGATPPDGWYTLAQGGETWHFHDEACLAIWRLTTLSIMPAQQETQSNPDYKARRFLLWDEQGTSYEGVRWSDDSVSIDPSRKLAVHPFYPSWGEFKAAHDGSGVQWIDQEVAE